MAEQEQTIEQPAAGETGAAGTTVEGAGGTGGAAGVTPAVRPWYERLIDAAEETGHAAEISYELGRDPAAAERILKLGPIQQIAAIVKYSAKFNGAAPVVPGTRTNALSDAPEPVRTVVGGSASPQKPTL